MKPLLPANTSILKKALLIILPLCLMLHACNWFKETPEVGLVLAEHFDSKLYKKFDTAAYNVIFNRHFDSLKSNFSNPNTLRTYYSKHQAEPQLVTKFFANGGLDSLKNYIGRSGEHGFDPKVFHYARLKSLLEKLSANQFKSIDEVYPVVADLELSAAESLIKYHNFVYYGSVNPRKLLSRYYIPVKRPDSASMSAVIETKDLHQLLREIQPASAKYKELQSALLRLEQSGGGDQQALKTLKVNMERLRWKLPDLGEEYVEVNIPDFTLTWFKKEDTLIHMKVCVGGAREADYAEKQKAYAKSGKLDDKPKNHETPLLYSKLNSIQVNPIWNIPVSIARS